MEVEPVDRRRALVFGEVAALYDKARPGYPQALLDDVLASVPHSSPRILEIGAGTGKATAELAQRGASVLALEPSREMAAIAESRLGDVAAIRILTTSFEAFGVTRSEQFDLVVSAQAWHWIEPITGVRKARDVLSPSGALALWWNKPRSLDAEILRSFNRVYRQVAPHLARRWSETLGTDFDGHRERIERSGLFRAVETREYDWNLSYLTEDYLALLQTHSDHILLDNGTLKRLLHGIARVLDGHGGALTLGYRSELLLAQVRVEA